MSAFERIKTLAVQTVKETPLAQQVIARVEQLRAQAEARWTEARREAEARLDELEAKLWEAIRRLQAEVDQAHRRAQRTRAADQHYHLLGLKPSASLEEVKAAWREKMRACHPDRFAHDPAAEARAHVQAQRLNLAYQELCALLTGRESRRG